MKPFARAIALIALAASSVVAHGEPYPNKLIKIVVPFPAGSDLDPIGRSLGDHFRTAWGQPYIVENRAGASAQIGTGHVAKQPADGHTLLICSPGPMTINPHLYAKLPYTVGKDIVPVSLIGTTPMVLVASTRMPVKNYADFVSYAKANPDKVFYASAGAGNITHLTAELFLRQAGLTATHTPFKGGQAAINDLLGGHVDFYFNPLPSARTYVQSQTDKVVPLAVTSLERSPYLPNVPTLNELGLKGFEVISWYGLCAHGDTPREILTQLSGETAKALAGGELPERLRNVGTTPRASTPEQFAEHVRRESAKWAAIIKDKDIRAD
ncbi:MAG: tripartite tricarboxylate transporter substrate binding protein [Burkholderiales bacterium]|jgi:tripartite-type tricarboxylate transporter receptor subunit TctC|nr:tripartite tricarboxylate transporter substrate binding protein [Burkholderiales bacterium]